MSWTLARSADIPAVIGLLTEREWGCVNLTSRLFTNARPRLPSPGTGKLAVKRRDEAVLQTVYMSRHGLIIPYLPGPAADESGTTLGNIFYRECGVPGTVVGIADYVDAFSAEIRIPPALTVDYHIMELSRRYEPESFGDIPDLVIRRALPEDLDSLLPLQEAYEREEVLLSQDLFDSGRTRSELKYNLGAQIIYVAEHRGMIVAKAGTNARGIGYDQIGGVYTLPEYRGRKVARRLLLGLLFPIFAEGKGACLFVKKKNAAALRLYTNLGFRIAESYKIGYFRI